MSWGRVWRLVLLVLLATIALVAGEQHPHGLDWPLAVGLLWFVLGVHVISEGSRR